jgi:murein DD-endopeptidase MepM/ murein hydrolase activator NlpD
MKMLKNNMKVLLLMLIASITTAAQPIEKTAQYESTLPNYFPLNRESITRISSLYGYRIHPISGKIKKHRGIDFVAKKGSAIYASAKGKVIKAGYGKRYGNYIVLRHIGNTKTLYAHLLAKKVTQNEIVSKGQVIGVVGDSGMVTGPHLHYEIWINDKRVNPLLFWNRMRINTKGVNLTSK